MALLSIQGVGKHFAGLVALEAASFDVEEGSVVGLIGPNGAGKTTLIDLITGVQEPSGGDICFMGESLVGLGPHRIANKGIRRTFQQIRLFDQLSITDNVMVGLDDRLRSGYLAALLSLPAVRREEASARETATVIISRICRGLATQRERAASQLPYADKRRLEIARALAGRPRLLLLDEPAAGMAPQEIRDLVGDLKRLTAEGVTILLVEHKMRVIQSATDKVVVFDHGRKIAEGPFEQVRRDRHVVEAYLGRGYADAAATAR